jgi:isoquinoline 1-oxidoreductase subunit alpha
MTRIIVNGLEHEIKSEPDTPLLWILRDELGMTGTKYGCGAAQCGACRVQVDGALTLSCVTPVGDIDGKKVVTIEGVSGKVADAVFAAWEKNQVIQCGYCQPGQIMAAVGLLSANPKPSDDDINQEEAMARNVCRCATYTRIRAAIHDAAKTLEG